MARLCCCGLRHQKKRLDGEKMPSQDPDGSSTHSSTACLDPPDTNALALSPQSTAAESSLTDPLPGAAADALVQSGELVMEDSEDDDGDDGLAQGIRSRGTSTVQVVKARLCRHLSQDSLSRRVETIEQIAHRAKVKRLMRKRIQEELQDETDDAVSEPSTSSSGLVSASATISVNGPRDTIEFMVQEDSNREPLISSRSKVLSLDKETRQPNGCSLCSQDPAGTESTFTQADCHKHSKHCSSGPDSPASPEPGPGRVPSFRDTSSFASWRLSLSAAKLAELLTPDKTLSPSGPVAGSFCSDGLSVTDNQGQASVRRPRSNSSSLVVQGPRLMSKLNASQVSLTSSYRMRIPPSQSLVREESPVGLWLRTQSQQFRRPQRRDSGAVVIADNDSHDPDDPYRHETTVSRLSEHIDHVREDHQLQVPEGAARCPHVLAGDGYNVRPSAWQMAVRDGSDKLTRTTPPSDTQPIVHSLAGNLGGASRPAKLDDAPIVSNVVKKGVGSLKLPSFRWPFLPNKGAVGVRPCPAPNSCLDNSILGPANSSSREMEVESGLNTSSPRRELLCRQELARSPEERPCGGSHLFEAPAPPLPVWSRDKETHLAKLEFPLFHLFPSSAYGIPTISHHFDGSGSDIRQKDTIGRSDHGHLKVPLNDNRANETRSSTSEARSTAKDGDISRPRGFSSSKDGDETAELWRRALRAESLPRSQRRSTSSHAPATELRGLGHDGDLLQGPRPSVEGRRSGPKMHVQSLICSKTSTQEDTEVVRQTPLGAYTSPRDLASLLDNQKRASKAISRRPLPSPPQAISTTSQLPPASWARFPSHNRDERNAVANEADDVKPKDFAIASISATGQVTWTTDKEDITPKQKSAVRSFSDKFTQPFRSQLSRFTPGRSTTSSRDRSMRGERRSSIQASGDLEYPELELLPTTGGYNDLRALEREINEMKGLTASRKPMTSTQADHLTKPSLAEGMTGVFARDGSLDFGPLRLTDMGGFGEGQTSCTLMHLPVTPASKVGHLDLTLAKNSSDSSGRRYATPLTHISSCPNGLSHSTPPDTALHLPLTGLPPNLATMQPRKVRSPLKNMEWSKQYEKSIRSRGGRPCMNLDMRLMSGSRAQS